MTDSPILQDCSPERAAFALDANKVAFGRLLSTLPQAVFYEEPGLSWYETGIPLNLFNGVAQAHLAQDTSPAAIGRVLAHFQQRQLPFHWTVGPSSQPADLGKLLMERGIEHDEDEPGMYADLLALSEDLPQASNLAVQPVFTRDQVQQWSRTTFCGAPAWVIQHLFTAYAGLPLGAQSPLRLYLGTLNGEMVATVELFLAAGVAYIGRVVTVHEARRQGIGASMTLYAAHQARAAGYRVAVLHASPMGINIYRSLGFKECCQMSTYAWYPPTTSQAS